jgi:hypothetical protein
VPVGRYRGATDAIVPTPDQGGETLQIESREKMVAYAGGRRSMKRSPRTDELF